MFETDPLWSKMSLSIKHNNFESISKYPIFFTDPVCACGVGGRYKPELQKDYFCLVSRFSTKKCPNHLIGEFCNYMRHKSTFRLVFYSFTVFLSQTMS